MKMPTFTQSGPVPAFVPRGAVPVARSRHGDVVLYLMGSRLHIVVGPVYAPIDRNAEAAFAQLVSEVSGGQVSHAAARRIVGMLPGAGDRP